MVTENPVSSSGCAVTTKTRGPCAKEESEKRHAKKIQAIVECFIAKDLNV